MKMPGMMIAAAVLVLFATSCGESPSAPAQSPSSDTLIEMRTTTTLAGVASHLTISVDGSIVFVEERGLRFPTKDNPATKTTRTGRLSGAELDHLLELVDRCPFDANGKSDARTKMIDTDAVSELSVHYQGKTRTITANYQPLFHLFHPDIPELSDVPKVVRELYQEIKHLIDSRTTPEPFR